MKITRMQRLKIRINVMKLQTEKKKTIITKTKIKKKNKFEKYILKNQKNQRLQNALNMLKAN